MNVQDSNPSQERKKNGGGILKDILTSLTRQTWIGSAIFVLLVIYILYAGRVLLLPIFVAFLLYFLLAPLVNWLKNKLHIPKFLGSALVLLVLLLFIGYLTYFLSIHIKTLIINAPYFIEVLNKKMMQLTTALRNRPAFLLGITEYIGYGLNASTIPDILHSWVNVIFSNTWIFLVELCMTLILLYFLLSSETFFLTRIAKRRKKEADLIIVQIEKKVWYYLFTRTVINIAVAIIVSLMLWAFELPNPVIWGVMAGFLEFIPFIGAFVSLIVITIVCIISFTNFWHIIAPPISFFIFISLEGNIGMPIVVGQRLILNKVAIILCIFLFGWIWGVMGAFLAVPILMTTKIIYDNVYKDNFMAELLSE